MLQNEGIHVSGMVIVRSHPAGFVERYHELAKTDIEAAQALFKKGFIKVMQNNIVVDSSGYGKDILVQYLISAYSGTFAFPLGIAWGEIGTGSTTPAIGDTALTTPTNRAPVTYAFDEGLNIAHVQFFFPDAVLANGTYYEAGSFIGGTSTIGTGNMFNHALFGTPYSKSAGSDSTLEIIISFT